MQIPAPMECPACGRRADEAARFCSSCGGALAAPGASASRPAGESVGETRLLTVLFTDLSGSVAATHGLDPEAAADRVNEVLDVMAAAIVRYDGRIDRYLGDGVLAFFGTPRAHEDDPVRAISAALEIRDEIERRGFRATSGINTGEVYLGRIGSDRHAEFSALGPVINLAARLQSKAEPGQVLVGEGTYRTARRSFEFRPLTLEVKGVPQPVRAHLAIRPLPRPEKVRGIEGVRAELVGRREEMERLIHAFEAVVAGHGRVVAVVGEAGIGKSRLIGELSRLVERRRALEEANSGEAEVLWLDGRCFETTTGTSYAPFVDLFHGLLGDGGRTAATPDRVATVLDDLVAGGEMPPDRASDARHLLARLVGPPADSEDPFHDAPPEQIRNQIFLAIRDLLAALSRRQPLVVFLDDLHWADALSLELSFFLMEATEGAPYLLLCAYRPGVDHPTRDLESIGVRRAHGRFDAIRLARLTDAESDRLLEALVPLADAGAGVREILLERAQGNPLFLEEMLRSLVDQGVVVRDGDEWRLVAERGVSEVPATIQGIILSRVDRLDAGTRHVLQAAAVIGRVFGRRLLEQVAPQVTGRELDLEDALALLERHDLVYLDRLVPDEEYSFKHVLTRDTVYGSLLRGRRAALHAAVARALETLHPDLLEEHCEQLARHYDEADDAGKALEYLWMAGDKARRAFLNPAAQAFYERALERLPAFVPEAGGARREEIAARLQESLGDVRELTGRHEDAVAAYDAALESIPAEDAIGRARILRKKGVSLQIQLRPADSMSAFGVALESLGPPGVNREEDWWRERIDIALGWMMLVYFSGSPDDLMVVLNRHRDEIERHGSPLQRGAVRRIQALAGLRRERYIASDETVEHARRSAETIEESGVLQEIGFARFNHAFALMWRGRLAESDPIMRSALALGERIGDVTLQCRCTAYLTLIARKQGNVESARRFAERTLSLAEAGELKEYLAAGHAHRAWVALREEDRTVAEREGRESDRLWAALGGPYRLLAWMPAWPLLGCAVERGDWDEARHRARFLLDPERQPMPAELTRALEAAARASSDTEAAAAFGAVARIARPLGYL
ncbi:MAG TPA: AAA family ATPase [Gemmatimonadota bacterium]|nr:AAA family ATPase [Gemmatimonadota bacterium]